MRETQTRWLRCGERLFKVFLSNEEPGQLVIPAVYAVSDSGTEEPMTDPDIEKIRAATQGMTLLMVKAFLRHRFGEWRCDEVASQ